VALYLFVASHFSTYRSTILVPYRLVLVFVLLISLPYLVALLVSGPQYSFGGFLLNPQDGNSYLAKMYEGWRGDWRFTLPYSSQPGDGAYLYTFYLLLGHLARWLDLSLLFVYHSARLIGSLLLAMMLWRFMKAVNPSGKHQLFTTSLACLGLGMGWLVLVFGRMTSDFWVAEAYPFLSAYTNPHFCFSLALMLWLISAGIDETHTLNYWKFSTWLQAVVVLISAAFLASMSPFAIVLVLGILIGVFFWELIELRLSIKKPVPESQLEHLPIQNRRGLLRLTWQILWTFLGGAPVVIYTFIAVRQDEMLSAWNAQNLTFTPPIWDLLLACSPVLILAFPGAIWAVGQKSRNSKPLIIWILLAILLAYAPFNLQRRFLQGIFVPLVALAGYGLDLVEFRQKKGLKLISSLVFALSMPSMMLVLLFGQFGAWTHQPLLYLEKREDQALDWIEANTPTHALIAATPRLGMFIPAHTGRRVIYGHPYETMDATAQETALNEFFQTAQIDPKAAREFLDNRSVDFILYGIPDGEDRELDAIPGLALVYDRDNVLIYKVEPF
jgi:hypothetical protein